MKKILFLTIAALVFSLNISAQTKAKPKTAPKKAAAPAAVKFEKGTVEGSQYTNKFFGITFAIPENWQVQEEIVNKFIKEEGSKSVKAKNTATQKAFNQAVTRLTIALTAFKEPFGNTENASFVLSFENMSSVPAIKDAVDYMDLMVNTFKRIQLPAGTKYSEVKAEKLGTRQFAFLDVTKPEANQRMYATMKKRYAIVFVFTYTNDADLETMRTMLANGNFNAK